MHRVQFSISRHTFMLVASVSFHTEKCCHLVSEHEVLARQHSPVPDLYYNRTRSFKCSFCEKHQQLSIKTKITDDVLKT